MSKHAMRARRVAAQRAAEDAGAPPGAPEAPGSARGAPGAARSLGARGAGGRSLGADPARALLGQLESSVAALDRLAADGRYTAEEQQGFVRAARPLRRQFAELAGRQFDANTAGYEAAAEALDGVAEELDRAQGRVEDLPAFMGMLARVAGVVDTLIRAVG